MSQRSFYQPSWAANDKERFDLRADAASQVRVSGTGKRPSPPRDLKIQSGARKVIVTWSKPVNDNDVAGWRIYKDTEAFLYDAIKDAGTRILEVSANGGATPPTVNVFVSSVSPSGTESVKVQIQGSATAEAGAPTDPAPPAPSGDLGGGGTGTVDSRVPSGRNFAEL